MLRLSARSGPERPLHPFINRKKLITKVTFTQNEEFINIHFVVWQFWGRAAEASWTEKSKALFLARFTLALQNFANSHAGGQNA
jgi:hypothetical protein